MTTDEMCDWLISQLRNGANHTRLHKNNDLGITQEEVNHCIKILLKEDFIEKNFQGFYILTPSGRDFEGFVNRAKRLEDERRSQLIRTNWAHWLNIITIISILSTIFFAVRSEIKNNEVKVLEQEGILKDKKIDSLIKITNEKTPKK